MELKRGIQEAVSVIVKGLKETSQPVETKDAIAQVASISANNDETIGNLIEYDGKSRKRRRYYG